MIKPIIPLGYSATQNDIDSGLFNAKTGGYIMVVDDNGADTGKRYEVGASGSVPIEAGGIKNNLAATTAPLVTNDGTQGYSTGSRWIDIVGEESYICLKATTGAAKWVVSTANTIGEIVNLQQTLDAKEPKVAGKGLSTVDFTTAKDTKLSGIAIGATANDTDVNLKARANHTGTQAQSTVDNLTTDLGNKSPLASPAFTGTPTGITKTHIGLANVDNTADISKPVSTAQQTALNLKQDASTAATDAELTAHTGNVTNPHLVTKTQVGLGSAENTSDLAKPVSTAQQTALDAKQANLVSGTNIKTVNGASVLGSGNVTVAADLPGGTAQTALDDGLVSGNATIDRATVPGQTILKYLTTGTTTFTPPTGVTSVETLVVAGGAGGGYQQGGGGGAGGLKTNASLSVTAGTPITVTVGAGGAGGTSSGAATNGTNSIFSTITATGGGGGGNVNSSGFAGGSGGGSGSGSTTIGTGTSGEGNNGGSGLGASPSGGGGGGGASAVGTAKTSSPDAATNAAGGAGTASTITGTSVTYAGGGGGGKYSLASGSTVASAGGVGGGGAGGLDAVGTAGTANRGGGGGGGGQSGNLYAGGAGGSGTIIVRFATQSRSYQALQSFADNASAIAGGRLVGEFFKLTSTGAVQQVT